MFSALLALSMSEKHLSWEWVTTQAPDHGDFTIRYNGQPTTVGDLGWWPILRYPDRWYIGDHIDVPILGKNNGIAKRGGWLEVRTEISQPIGDNYYLVEFIVNQSSSDSPTTFISSVDISLSCYCFVSHDASAYDYRDWEGIKVKDKKTGLTHIFITQNGYGVRNTRTLWYDNPGSKDLQYLYFNTNAIIGESKLDRPMGFVISWNNIKIYGGQTERIGFLIGVGHNLKYPPQIKVENQLKWKFAPNEEVTINVSVSGIDAAHSVTLYYTFNGQKHEAGHINSETGNFSEFIDFNVTTGADISRNPLKIWAEDNENIKSNVIDVNLLVNEAPILNITNEISGYYSRNCYLEIQGTIWDDTKAYLSYQLDDYTIKILGGDYICNKSTKHFAFTIPFFNDRSSIHYGTHTVKIWATDEFGVKSNIQSFSIQYDSTQTPQIQINQSEVPTLHYNENVTIKGQVRHVNDYFASIYYLPPTSQLIDPFQFAKNINLNYWVPDKMYIGYETYAGDFEINYQIPNLSPGQHQIIFKAVDKRGARSAYAYFNFTFAKLPTPSPMPSPQPPVIPQLPQGYDGPTDYSTTTSYTKSSTIDINGDSSFIWVPTNATYPITTFIPTRTPNPSSTPVITTLTNIVNAGQLGNKDLNDQQKDNDDNWPIIVGTLAAIALAVVIGGIIIYHERKQRSSHFNEEDAATEEVDNVADDQDSLPCNNNESLGNDFELEQEDPA